DLVALREGARAGVEGGRERRRESVERLADARSAPLRGDPDRERVQRDGGEKSNPGARGHRLLSYPAGAAPHIIRDCGAAAASVLRLRLLLHREAAESAASRYADRAGPRPGAARIDGHG